MLSSLAQWLSPPRRRNRAVELSPAMVLESRELLSATVGPVLWQSGALAIEYITATVKTNDSVIVVGRDITAGGHKGAQQRIERDTGSVHAIEYFWSVAESNSGEFIRSSESSIQDVAIQEDGTLFYVGWSDRFGDEETPTLWFGPNDVRDLHAGVGYSSEVPFVAAPNGMYAGGFSPWAFVGSTTQPWADLQPFHTGAILSMTEDGEYLGASNGWLGDGVGKIWRARDVNSFQYDQVDYYDWPIVEGSLGFPADWRRVARNTNGVYFAAEIIDYESFATRVGVWRADGVLIGATELGDTLVDLYEIEDHLVLGVNGLNGGAVYSFNDLTIGNRIDLSDRLGTDDDYLVGAVAGGTFFNDELGVIVNVGGQSRAVSFDFLVTPDAITVPSAVHQGSYNANVVSTKVSTFEVGLKGSASFDVTKIDKATLFIGDERNTVSGKITSIKFTDTNKDGFKDAMIKVQTTGAVRTDTTRLKITGKTTTGDDFDGSLNVTSTSQTWQAHWLATNGAAWKTAYTLFTKGLKKTWW